MRTEAPPRWRRWAIGTVVIVVIVVLGSTWFGSSRTGVHALVAADELLVINDAGPVRVRSLASYDGPVEDIAGGGMLVRSSESWLFRGPEVEVLSQGAASAIRVSCPSRLPCRASLEIFVPAGVELSIVAANDLVQVDSFDGAMSVFAGSGGVFLGSVAGSVSVVSDGPVRGASLGPAELTVDVVDDAVSLSYLDAPMIVAVKAGEAAVVIELPATADYALAADGRDVDLVLESASTSDRLVSVQSTGSISIRPTPPDDDS